MEKDTSNKYKFQYAVKIICTSHIPGTSQTSDGLLPGVYEAAVNMHNPHGKDTRIRKKLAHASEITKYKSSEIKPDGVERFVCRNINDFGITFIHGFEGFLILESDFSLDVTAVYTAGSSGGSVSSIAVEQIRERQL